jgi:hypothetical protein
VLLLLAPGNAAGAGLETAAQIDACYQANFPQDTSVQTVSMSARDRIGALSVAKTTLYWKRFQDGLSKMLMRFADPPEMRGAALLMVETQQDENDMFMYLPELGRVKRVTSRMTSASMFGTDFSYEEFERMQGMARSSETTRLADARVGARDAYVLETRPERKSSAYERIVSFIDKQTCLLLRADFFERGDEARKLLTVDAASIAEVGGVWYAKQLLMRDLRDETETSMRVEKVEVGVSIPPKMFSQTELVAGGR